MGEIKDELQRYKLQIIGSIMLVLSLITGLIGEIGIAFILLAMILILDLYIITKKHDTITKWLRRQFKSWLDKIIMALLFVLITKCAGWEIAFWFTFGTINGHLFWDK